MIVSDDFNRTAETPLQAPWVTCFGAGGCHSNGAEAVGTNTVLRTSFYDGEFGNNQFAEGIVGALLSGSRYANVYVRMSNAKGGHGYEAFTDGVSGSSHTGIGRYDAGVFLQILAINTAFSNGDRMRIQAIGNTITVMKNGEVIGSISDSTYGAGYPGVGAFGVATVDDWTGGDIEHGVKGRRMIGWKYSR